MGKAFLSAKLEEDSTTSREAALLSRCSVSRLPALHSGWTSSAERTGDHRCIFVVTGVGCKDARGRICEQLG